MLKKFLRSTSGTVAIEYGFIALLIGVAIIGSVAGLGEQNEINYDTIATEVGGAMD